MTRPAESLPFLPPPPPRPRRLTAGEKSYPDLLLDNRWAPITRAMGLLQVPVQEAVERFVDWQLGIRIDGIEPYQLATRTVTGTLEDALAQLLPLTRTGTRHLFLPTRHPEWTAVFQNSLQGTDVSSMLAVLCERHGIRGINVIEIPHTLSKDQYRGLYGARAMVTYTPKGERWLRLLRETSGWEFTNIGTPYPFEDLDRYTAPRTTDRFTHQMLVDYLAHLDLHPFDEDFYLPHGQPAILVGRTDLPSDITTFTLAEARAGNEDQDVPRARP